MTRAAALLLAALLAASCRSKGDATPPAAPSASATAGHVTAPPPDPDEADPAGAAESPSSPAGSASGKPVRERAALPLPPTAMPDPPLPPERRPDAGGLAAIVSIFDDYGFPHYPRVEALCGKRVYKQGGTHLTWDAFASNDEPAALVAHYKRRLGEPGFSAEADGGTWRLPAGARTPERTLSISRKGQQGPWDACEKKPGADAKSILMVSRDH